MSEVERCVCDNQACEHERGCGERATGSFILGLGPVCRRCFVSFPRDRRSGIAWALKNRARKRALYDKALRELGKREGKLDQILASIIPGCKLQRTAHKRACQVFAACERLEARVLAAQGALREADELLAIYSDRQDTLEAAVNVA